MADTTNLLGTIAGIPQSLALAEAEVDSLSELLSRDPEGYAEQDLDRVIEELRRQRERIAAAKASGAPKKSRQVATANSPSDLGF